VRYKTTLYIIIIIIIIIGIQPMGQFGQRPELSQGTGMALVSCNLGKFLGGVCHCFPLQYIYICIPLSRSMIPAVHMKTQKSRGKCKVSWGFLYHFNFYSRSFMFHRNVTKHSANDTTSCATRHETSLTLLEGRRPCCL